LNATLVVDEYTGGLLCIYSYDMRYCWVIGDYSMEIRVDIQTGGNDVCPHIEQGEEVGYDLHYQSRKLRIEPRD
jgi:hypothetical protein